MIRFVFLLFVLLIFGPLKAQEILLPEKVYIKNFSSSETVVIENMAGDFTIIQGIDNRVEVKVHSENKKFSSISIRELGKTLYVTGVLRSGQKRIPRKTLPKITLTIPKSMPLKFVNHIGDVKVKDSLYSLDIEAITSYVQLNDVNKVNIKVIGTCDIDIKKITESFNLNVLGVSKAKIDHVSNNLNVSIVGNGKVEIKEGMLEKLLVDISGIGDFIFKGQARKAQINLSGAGKVRINKVSEQIIENITGTGVVQVDYRPQ